MKRLYTLVSSEKTAEGYVILLDERVVKTKAGQPLCTPVEDIANEVVQEWVRQEKVINPDTMPFTQILNTKIDRVSTERARMSDTILKYLDTDLICYCADTPQGLVSMQDSLWAPWRLWAAEKFGHAPETTTGLIALSQPSGLHDHIGAYVQGINDDRFTILQIAVPLTGSLILGLAFLEGVARAQDVFAACFVEEKFKDTLYDAEKYGADPHTESQQDAVLRDLQACETYLKAITVL